MREGLRGRPDPNNPASTTLYLMVGSTKLVVLMKSLFATLPIMPDALYHASIIYHTLKCALSLNQGSCSLLKVSRQSHGESPNLLKLRRDVGQGISRQ